jgi:hypothetical protein
MASGGLIIGNSNVPSAKEDGADTGASSLRLALDGSESVAVVESPGAKHTKLIDLDDEPAPKTAAMTEVVVVTPDDSECKKSTRVSREDLEAGMDQMRMMRNVVVFGLIIIVVLLVGIVFATMFAIRMAAEYHVKDTQLIDTDGHGVATVEKLGAIAGVRFAPTRRLSDSNMSIEGDVYDLEMKWDEFASTRTSYTQGLTDWVVGLPDTTVRSVRISSVDGGVAYGTTSSWWGSILWTASCPTQIEGSACQITWTGGDDFSYAAFDISQTSGLPVTTSSAPLDADATPNSSETTSTTGMARRLAARAGRDGSDRASTEGLDRSLGSSKSSM